MAGNSDHLDVTVELNMRWWVAPFAELLEVYIRLTDGLLWPFMDEDRLEAMQLAAIEGAERLISRHGVYAKVVDVQM